MTFAIIEVFALAIGGHNIDTAASTSGVSEEGGGIDIILMKGVAYKLAMMVVAYMADEGGGVAELGIATGSKPTSLTNIIDIFGEIALNGEVDRICMEVYVGVDADIANDCDLGRWRHTFIVLILLYLFEIGR